MDLVLAELAQGWPDRAQAVAIVMRMLAAALLGGIVGFERARTGKEAGLRTHMLVSLGSALFVMAAADVGVEPGDVSRVIQGVAAGVGFLGAGAILKLTDQREIRGLTTAAGIWMTAATGLAAGLGRYGLALIAALLSLLILAVVPSAQPDEEKPKSGKKTRSGGAGSSGNVLEGGDQPVDV
jgi:putative Mg2+ transporter-C (MgtC) family protein